MTIYNIVNMIQLSVPTSWRQLVRAEWRLCGATGLRL